MQVKARFACDLPTIWYHEQVLDGIINLAKSGIPLDKVFVSVYAIPVQKGGGLLRRLAYPVLAMVHLQWFTCDELLGMATRNNCRIMLYDLSWKAHETFRISVKTV